MNVKALIDYAYEQGEISMLHCFAMKMYSNRRKKKLQLIKEDLKNELSV